MKTETLEGEQRAEAGLDLRVFVEPGITEH